MDGKHLIRFQSETSVFQIFIRLNVNRALPGAPLNYLACLYRSTARATRRGWNPVSILRGGSTPVVILKTLVFDAWVRTQHENAWTSVETAILKSRGKWNAECVWLRV